MGLDLRGTEIHGYTLVEQVGEGGMAVVWRAEHPMLRTTVAVKLMDPMLSRDENLVGRFLDEARIQVQLKHPNIVRIENFSQDPLAMVMEFVEGRSLSEMIGKEVGPIPTNRALPMMRQILSAVAYAHGHGVVHRDIKPSNVVITPTGEAKVMDFGIAKVLGSQGRTRTGASMGTPAYMAPEQIKGARDVDARADIYALGVTFYEMLSGRTPFDTGVDTASEFDLMEAQVRQAPPDPREFYPEIPEDMVAALMKALAKDPDERFQNAEELQIAIEHAAGTEPEMVSPILPEPGPQEPVLAPEDGIGVAVEQATPALPPWRGEQKKWWIIGGSSGAAVILVLVVVLIASGSKKQETGLPSLTTAAHSSGASAPAMAGEKAPTPEGPTATPVRQKATLRDSCAMVSVPAGEFLRGSPAGEGDENEHPPKKIYLDAFSIDQHEVTVRQYRACMTAGECSSPKTGNKYCNTSHSDREDHPINCVNWDQAKKYCAWAGKRLPTEAEWEKAARGTDGRRFAWGNETPSCNLAVMIDGKKGCGKFHTWPVGSKSPAGDSPYGAKDMTGNVNEWTSDWFDEGYYQNTPEKNPQGPSSGTRRAIRGGSWFNPAKHLPVARRQRGNPIVQYGSLGFRCAMN